MQFNIKEWRRIYDRVHHLGKKFKDSFPDFDGNPPVAPLDRHEQDQIQTEMSLLTNRSNRYLDATRMRFPAPLWHYNRKDPKTWASHESFKFGHLMSFGE